MAFSSAGGNNLTLLKNGSIYCGLCAVTTGSFNSGHIELRLATTDNIAIGNPGSITVGGGTPASNGTILSICKVG